MNLYLYNNFSNYYNKRIKRYTTLADYGDPIFIQSNVNFNPNDGVNTVADIGGTSRYDGTADYCLVVLDGEIISRWFVIEHGRNHAGQWKTTLRRDLIADFYDEFMSSTVYLEKGWINNASDPLLFNNENYYANQIKKNETPLIGKDKCMWLIGYVDKPGKITQDGTTIPSTFWNGTEMTTNIAGNIDYDVEIPSWNSWEYWPLFGAGGAKRTVKSTQNIETTYYLYFGNYDFYAYRQDKNGFIDSTQTQIYAGMDTSILRTNYDRNQKNWWVDDYIEQYDDIDKGMYTALNADMTYKQYQSLLELDGKIVHCLSPGENQPEYIRVSAKITTQYLGASGVVKITASSAPTAYNKLAKISRDNGASVNDNNAYYNCYTYYAGLDTSYQTINTLGIENYKWQTDDSGHAHAVNEAYDIFAIPISTDPTLDVQVVDYEGNIGHIAANREAGFITAQSLIQQAGSGGYDLQLVPYGPIDDGRITASNGVVSFDCSTLSQTFDYSIVYTQQNIARTVIFWLTKNSVSHTIDITIDNETTPEAIKAANQLDVYRLSSGDYSAQFEFSPVRNRGVSSFVADITFKPFAPWVRVAPFFNPDGLYGQEWKDTRGLVCSNTNFSLSRANNAWETYERNNLNYQNAFNRQIDYMDELHKIERGQAITNAVVGTVGAAAIGSTLGRGTGKLGLGMGIGAGAVSAGAGVADVLLGEWQYSLNRDNTIAQHNEELANIKAMPNTLAAAGANTINNKVFPLLVYYSCTDAERENFTTTLSLRGMSINRFTDDLTQYINPNNLSYLKGQLLHINVAEDNHLVYEIAQELNNGFYIVPEEE